MPPDPPGPVTPPETRPDPRAEERQQLIENLAVLVVRRHRRLQHEARRREPSAEQAVDPRRT